MTLDEQVKALREKFGDRIPHHACGICGGFVAYVFEGERLFFDPHCGCAGDGDLEPRNLSDLHEFLEMNPGWTERQVRNSSDSR